MKVYRLVYRDGSHGAWSSDYERTLEYAKFFKARIEEMVIEK